MQDLHELAKAGHLKEIEFIDTQVNFGVRCAGEWQRYIDKLGAQKAALGELWEQRSKILLDDPKPPPSVGQAQGNGSAGLPGKDAAGDGGGGGDYDPVPDPADTWAQKQPEECTNGLINKRRFSADPKHVIMPRNYAKAADIEDEAKQREALAHIVEEARTDWTKGSNRKDSPEMAAASLFWCLLYGVKKTKELPTGRPVSIIPYLKKYKFNNPEPSIRLRVLSKMSAITGVLFLGVRGKRRLKGEFVPCGAASLNCKSTMVILDPDLKKWDADDIVDALMAMHCRVANNPLTILENLNASELPRQFAAHHLLYGADPRIDGDKSDRVEDFDFDKGQHGNAKDESQWSRWRASRGIEFVKVADFWWNDKGFSAHIPVRFLTQRQERRQAKKLGRGRDRAA
jgi:hypothetical protein